VTVVRLRTARFVDCLDVWRWNFAPDVRAQSTSQLVVDLGEHARWFSHRLRSQDPIWIIEEDRCAIGVVRLDRQGDQARISIALAPEARGRQIGRKAIELACRAGGFTVTAEIAASNAASQKCFKACGFTLAFRTTERLTYRWSA
jgi:RimJ/RimL family protein N-acetyltransferase